MSCLYDVSSVLQIVSDGSFTKPLQPSAGKKSKGKLGTITVRQTSEAPDAC